MSRRALPALILCGVVLFGLTALGLWLQAQDRIGIFVAVAAVQGAVYLAAVRLASTTTPVIPAGAQRRAGIQGQATEQPPPDQVRGGLWMPAFAGMTTNVFDPPDPIGRALPTRRIVLLILGFALAMRALLVFAPPYLSTDVYRYVWDGRVIAAGINPYRYIPTDRHLASLRDPDIFPNINRANYAHTIYPPAAEAIFFAATRASASVTAMKAAMVGFEAVAVALLLRLLAARGQPAGRIILYAWHPLPLWEFAGSGHIDAAIVALVALALWSRRNWITGLALAGGTLVKFYPVALLPALWRRGQWPMPLVFALVVVAAYLPFLGVGWSVFGFLPGYLGEEGFAGGGSGFYLWGLAGTILPLAGVSNLVYVGIAAAAGGGLALWVVRRQIVPAAGTALLAGAFMLLVSPHYPWYFAWLVVFACLVPSAALLWLTLASFLLYLIPVGSQLVWDRPRLLVESALYLPFILLAAADLLRRRRTEQLEDAEPAPS